MDNPMELMVQEIRKDIKDVNKNIGTLAVTLGGLKTAVETQNGRVTKLEGRWEKIIFILVFALLGALASLVSYIFLQQPIQISEAQIIDVLESINR